MTSKIISGKAEEIKEGLKKSEVKILKKKKELIIKEDGKADQVRDLTQLSPPYNLAELRAITDISDILNQCIEAYATNVAGFGFGVRYLIDDVEETEEMKAEWSTLESLLKDLSYERPAKEVIQEVIRHVEECGNGFIEVIRNLRGEVVGIDSIKPEYMTVTKLNKVINNQGQEIKVRYFVFSDSTNDSEVENGTWYKSFGDPTLLDTNGTIGAGTATEVIHLKNGDFQDPYGIPRWIGPLIKIIGNRKADELNYRYFTQGRHVPLAIVLENAELTPESETSLQNYANSVGGEANQHKFLLLEAEKVSPVDQMIDDDKTKASVRIEKLTDILQQDALFLEYDENVSQAVLGAFRLPPIYVAKTTEYNRSTAETAKELTEEQVFQPLRESYAWRLNDLFKEYGFKYVEVYFKSPNLSNMDDIKAILSPAIQARAVAPNDLRDLLSKVLNKPLEDFEGDEYNLPNSAQTVRQGQDLGLLDISKAYGVSESSEIAASIRRLIKEAKNDR